MSDRRVNSTTDADSGTLDHQQPSNSNNLHNPFSDGHSTCRERGTHIENEGEKKNSLLSKNHRREAGTTTATSSSQPAASRLNTSANSNQKHTAHEQHQQQQQRAAVEAIRSNHRTTSSDHPMLTSDSVNSGQKNGSSGAVDGDQVACGGALSCGRAMLNGGATDGDGRSGCAASAGMAKTGRRSSSMHYPDAAAAASLPDGNCADLALLAVEETTNNRHAVRGSGNRKESSDTNRGDKSAEPLRALARMQQQRKSRRRSSFLADLRAHSPPPQPSEPGGAMPLASSNSDSCNNSFASAGVVSSHTVPQALSPSGRRRRISYVDGYTASGGSGKVVGTDLLFAARRPTQASVSGRHGHLCDSGAAIISAEEEEQEKEEESTRLGEESNGSSPNGFNEEPFHASLTISELSMTRTEDQDDPIIIREMNAPLDDAATATTTATHSTNHQEEDCFKAAAADLVEQRRQHNSDSALTRSSHRSGTDNNHHVKRNGSFCDEESFKAAAANLVRQQQRQENNSDGAAGVAAFVPRDTDNDTTANCRVEVRENENEDEREDVAFLQALLFMCKQEDHLLLPDKNCLDFAGHGEQSHGVHVESLDELKRNSDTVAVDTEETVGVSLCLNPEQVDLGEILCSPSASMSHGSKSQSPVVVVDQSDAAEESLDNKETEFRRSVEFAQSIGLSDEDMLNAALAESEWAEESDKQLKLDEDLLDVAIAESSSATKIPESSSKPTKSSDEEDPPNAGVSSLLRDVDMDNVKANVDTMRDLCEKNDVDAAVLQSVLGMCKQDQRNMEILIEAAFERQDTDVYKLLDLNSNIVRAIESAESKVASRCQEEEKTPPPPPIARSLEAQPEDDDDERKRLEAALALMKFARDSRQSPDNDDARGEGTNRRSSRGEEGLSSLHCMQSLLDLFHAREPAYELKVVAAVAVAYALPLFVSSRTLVPLKFASKIIECIRFLSCASRSVVVAVLPNGEETVTREECSKASALGTTTFWTGILKPWLDNHSRKLRQRPTVDGGETLDLSSTPPGSRSFSWGVIQDLLEICVPLIIRNNSDVNGSDKALVFQEDGSLGASTNVLLEEVCAADLARPIAVRNGILPILAKGIESEDSQEVTVAVRCLRWLASVKDNKQLADMMHFQMVTQGGVLERIVALTRDRSVATSSHDVRLAIAQILSYLCTSGPRARAAVVSEANSTEFLIGFFVAHAREVSHEVACLMTSALATLAADALGCDIDGTELRKQHNLLDDIIESGATDCLMALALEHGGEVRSFAVEALRILSEDISPTRQTRLQLCEGGAARTLSLTLKHVLTELTVQLKEEEEDAARVPPRDPLKDAIEALLALGNIMDPVVHDGTIRLCAKQRQATSQNDFRKPLINCCLETVESGGLESLLKIASIPVTGTLGSEAGEQLNLLQQSCRSLALISPLLFSEVVQSAGYTGWADSVLTTFSGVLSQLCWVENLDHIDNGLAKPIRLSVLKGVRALAQFEPLKLRIVDKVLPMLLQTKTDNDRDGLSHVAIEVFRSLDFAEDDDAVLVEENNLILQADWFCLRRSLVFQAMVRSEIRQWLNEAWKIPSQANSSAVRGISRDGSDAYGSDSEHSARRHLFCSFANDACTSKKIETILRQYGAILDSKTRTNPRISANRPNNEGTGLGDDRSLARQIYPLNSSAAETDWILSHRQECASVEQEGTSRVNMGLSNHAERLLRLCFPSMLLRDQVLPLFDFRPDSLFDFRVAMMPQRHYVSFHNECRMLSRLLESEVSTVNAAGAHWTLAFTNSTFSGEFAKSLAKTLCLCRMVLGLSFSRNEDWRALSNAGEENLQDDEVWLLDSLPPWISHLTFDGVLNDRCMRALVEILSGKRKTYSGAKAHKDLSGWSRDRKRYRAAQENFEFVAIRRSPRLTPEAWTSFFSLFGVGTPPARGLKTPFSTLRNLDLSGNLLGDDICGIILELAHNPESGCSLEHLDLSGNRIHEGKSVLKVLRCYVENHRYSQPAGTVRNQSRGWTSPLRSLYIADNDLHVGNAWLEMIALLKNDVLELKALDMSSNGLALDENDNESGNVIVSSLTKNQCLWRINLSHNKLGASMIDKILRELSAVANDSNLIFLHLEGNFPPLSDKQTSMLSSLSMAVRDGFLKRRVNRSSSKDG